MDPVFSVYTAISLTISSVYMMINQIMTNVPEYNAQWYDKYNSYYTFDAKLTEYIDELIDPTKNYQYINSKKTDQLIDEHFNKIPDIGTYMLTLPINNNPHITFDVYLIKDMIKQDNKNVLIYKAYCENKIFLDLLVEFLKKKQNQNKVIITSIDTAEEKPKTIKLTKICKNPKQNQMQAINLILNHWNDNNDFNTKVIISGPRGVGKTYLGRVLKKHLETLNLQSNFILYDDFNPSSIGVNINTIALKFAKLATPVIIVVNEIDTYYDKVNNPEPSFDPRLQHTRNKGEFHNMLDALGSVPYVIVLFTTEILDIKAVDEYASFIRPGRTDLFIRMDVNDAIQY